MARPYVAVHASGWDGDLVASMFIRFARHDSVLEAIFNYGIIATSGAQVSGNAVASGQQAGVTVNFPRRAPGGQGGAGS